MVEDPQFYAWEADHWLGHEVEFTLHGKHFIGVVESARRFHLVNGIHDILTVEIWDNFSQVKVQAHRQKFKRTS